MDGDETIYLAKWLWLGNEESGWRVIEQKVIWRVIIEIQTTALLGKGSGQGVQGRSRQLRLENGRSHFRKQRHPQQNQRKGEGVGVD